MLPHTSEDTILLSKPVVLGNNLSADVFVFFILWSVVHTVLCLCSQCVCSVVPCVRPAICNDAVICVLCVMRGT